MLSAEKMIRTLVMDNEKSPVLGVICLLLIGGMLIACFWPFNFVPVNKVGWIQNGNGIRFYGQGIVFSRESLVTPAVTSRKKAPFTIELLIRPIKEPDENMPSILTLYDRDLEQIIISQWKTTLIIQSAHVQNEYREIGIENALRKDVTHLIIMTSGEEGTDIYVDGKIEKSFPHYSLLPDDQKPAGCLILGNSPGGNSSWNGAFFGLAILDRSLSGKEALDHYRAWRERGQPLFSGSEKPLALYLFDEHGGEQILDHSGSRNHLLMPAIFKPVHRIILIAPWNESWFSLAYLTDFVINILGFMPFGFFVTAWLWRAKNLPAPRVYGICIFLGFCMSLAIEIVQAYLPTRGSSVIDVVSNTLGTAAGAFLFKYAALVPRSMKQRPFS